MNDGLHRLVDMVEDMLALHLRCLRAGVSGCFGDAAVFELTQLVLDTAVSILFIVVVEFTFLDVHHSVGVLFRKSFLVLDGLYSSVVSMLVDLLLESGRGFFVSVRLDSLRGDGGLNPLINLGAVAFQGCKILDGFLGGFHFVDVDGQVLNNYCHCGNSLCEKVEEGN